MKKRLTSLFLLSALALSLAACGGGGDAKETKETTKAETAAKETTAAPTTEAPKETTAAAAETEPAEAPYVEVEPDKNELDASSPIPPDTGTLALTEQVFEDENLKLMLPEGVSVVNEGQDNMLGHITVTDDAGEWKLMFRPFKNCYANIESGVAGNIIFDGNPVKTDWSEDVPTELDGFPARVWANNTREHWLNPSNEQEAPAVDILIDYGETLAGPWYGLYIRLEAADPKDDTNIYTYLYRRHLRAVLNNFSVIRTADLVEHAANGITVSFPARWDVKEGESSVVGISHSDEKYGGITFMTALGADPQALADEYGEDQFGKEYAGTGYKGVISSREIQTGDGEISASYDMILFTEFDENRSVRVNTTMRGFGPDDYMALLDDPQFTAIMESVKIDPAAWHAPGTAEVSGLVTERGVIDSYDGTEEALEIPAEIGGYSTTAIGMNAFMDNPALKSVVIPEGVTEIGENAFWGCENLETVVLPETLSVISQDAFGDCPNLTDVVLPDNVSYVGYEAFCGSGKGSFTGSSAYYDTRALDSTGFDSIVIPAGSDISAYEVFQESQASEIILPDDLEVIGSNAFNSCANLHEIKLPETVRTIGQGAFSHIPALTSINLPEGITEIPDSCFTGTQLDVLVIPSTVTKIGSYATQDAAVIVVQNPYAEIGYCGVQGDYIFLEDAQNHVFANDMEISGRWLYLDGVYDPTQLQGDVYNGTGIISQFYVPSDAAEAESDALDEYLLSIGYDEISWFGSAKDFLPESTIGFTIEEGVIQGYSGDSERIAVPYSVLVNRDGTWDTEDVTGIADEAFKDSTFRSISFIGGLSVFGARILDGNTELQDLWFNTDVLFDAIDTVYDSAAFEGIPDDVTIHLPDSMSDSDRESAEDFLHSVGVPESASFEYYSLRDRIPTVAEPPAESDVEETEGEETEGEETEGEETEGEETEGEETEGEEIEGGDLEGVSEEDYINDGTIEGRYQLYIFMGMNIIEFAQMADASPEEAAALMEIEIVDENTAVFYSEGDSSETEFSLDGENFTMSADGDEVSGTLKDGLMTLDIEGETVVLARLTEAAFAE